jgi:NAD(P)-dependent dehydrogenase (short-subunit alcohol dehydrogenase family)
VTASVNDGQEFAGKAMIVSGASKGIGRAVAELAARRGASLVIVGRGQAALDEAAEALSAHGGKVVSVAGDVSKAETAARAVQAALDAFGRLDVLANIAGAFPTALLEDTTDEMYHQTIAANLTGTFMMCRAALPAMRAGGGGSIVNMSSTAARFATPGLAAYGASKAGVEALTRAIALEGAPLVRVNAISAGPTLTETVRALVESDTTGAVETVTRALPLGRMAEPREIAEAVLFLASDRASIITGQVLHANSGGLMA